MVRNKIEKWSCPYCKKIRQRTDGGFMCLEDSCIGRAFMSPLRERMTHNKGFGKGNYKEIKDIRECVEKLKLEIREILWPQDKYDYEDQMEKLIDRWVGV